MDRVLLFLSLLFMVRSIYCQGTSFTLVGDSFEPDKGLDANAGTGDVIANVVDGEQDKEVKEVIKIMPND